MIYKSTKEIYKSFKSYYKTQLNNFAKEFFNLKFDELNDEQKGHVVDFFMGFHILALKDLWHNIPLDFFPTVNTEKKEG